MNQLENTSSTLKTLTEQEIDLVSGGFTDDLTGFPPWVWPIIRPGDFQKQFVKNVVKF